VSELPIFVGEIHVFFSGEMCEIPHLVSEIPIFVGEIHVSFSGEMCEIAHLGE